MGLDAGHTVPYDSVNQQTEVLIETIGLDGKSGWGILARVRGGSNQNVPANAPKAPPSLSLCAADNVGLRICTPLVLGRKSQTIPLMGMRGAGFIMETVG